MRHITLSKEYPYEWKPTRFLEVLMIVNHLSNIYYLVERSGFNSTSYLEMQDDVELIYISPSFQRLLYKERFTDHMWLDECYVEPIMENNNEFFSAHFSIEF